MTDISKCTGILETTGATAGKSYCPWKETCYRYTAPEDSSWQAWASFPGQFNPDGSFTCIDYWNRNSKQQRF